MVKKLAVYIVLAGILLPGLTLGQDLSGIPGAFADIGLGTRPLGMGGAYIAVAAEENAARWNPAALGKAEKRSAGFTWARQFNLVPYNYLAGTLPRETMGLGFFIESAGDDVYRENTIAVAAGVTSEQLKLPARLHKKIPNVQGLSLGLTWKIRWVSFGNNPDGGVGQVQGNAIGYGLDIGFLYNPPTVPNVTAAVVFRDLLNTIAWDSHSPDTDTRGRYTEGVPRSLIIGFAYTPREQTLLTFDLSPAVYGDTHARFRTGMEYRLLKIISLRGGFAQNFGTRWINRDLTLGLGLDYPIGKRGTLKAGVSYLFDSLVHTPRVGLAFVW